MAASIPSYNGETDRRSLNLPDYDIRHEDDRKTTEEVFKVHSLDLDMQMKASRSKDKMFGMFDSAYVEDSLEVEDCVMPMGTREVDFDVQMKPSRNQNKMLSVRDRVFDEGGTSASAAEKNSRVPMGGTLKAALSVRDHVYVEGGTSTSAAEKNSRVPMRGTLKAAASVGRKVSITGKRDYEYRGVNSESVRELDCTGQIAGHVDVGSFDSRHSVRGDQCVKQHVGDVHSKQHVSGVVAKQHVGDVNVKQHVGDVNVKQHVADLLDEMKRLSAQVEACEKLLQNGDEKSQTAVSDGCVHGVGNSPVSAGREKGSAAVEGYSDGHHRDQDQAYEEHVRENKYKQRAGSPRYYHRKNLEKGENHESADDHGGRNDARTGPPRYHGREDSDEGEKHESADNHGGRNADDHTGSPRDYYKKNGSRDMQLVSNLERTDDIQTRETMGGYTGGQRPSEDGRATMMTMAGNRVDGVQNKGVFDFDLDFLGENADDGQIDDDEGVEESPKLDEEEYEELLGDDDDDSIEAGQTEVVENVREYVDEKVKDEVVDKLQGLMGAVESFMKATEYLEDDKLAEEMYAEGEDAVLNGADVHEEELEGDVDQCATAVKAGKDAISTQTQTQTQDQTQTQTQTQTVQDDDADSDKANVDELRRLLASMAEGAPGGGQTQQVDMRLEREKLYENLRLCDELEKNTGTASQLEFLDSDDDGNGEGEQGDADSEAVRAGGKEEDVDLVREADDALDEMCDGIQELEDLMQQEFGEESVSACVFLCMCRV